MTVTLRTAALTLAAMLALVGCTVSDDPTTKKAPDQESSEANAEVTEPASSVTTKATEEPTVKTSEEPAKEPTEVTVPVMKKDPDTEYAAKDTAVVTNEEYSDGDRGTVTVTAMNTREPCGVSVACTGSNDHWLTARILLKSGGRVVVCEEFRSHVWGDDQVYEDIPIPCEKKLPLSDVKSVVLVAP